MSERPTNGASAERSPAASAGRLGAAADASALLLALLVVSRPLTGGLGESLAESALAMLGLLAAAALWLGGRMRAGSVRLHMGPAALAFAAFLAVACVSGALTPDRFAAARWCLLILTYGLGAGLAFHVAREDRYRRFLWACLLATCVALAGYALWHYALYLPAMRRWFASEPGLVGLGAAGGMPGRDVAARVGSDRAYGNFLTANQLASFTLLGLFPLVGLAWARFRAGRRRGRGVPVVMACGTALLVTALALSRSKGALIALAVGALVFLLLGARLGGTRPRAAICALAVLAMAAAGAWAAGLLPDAARFARSLNVRLGYWEASLEMVARRPLLGVGPGAWADWYGMLKEPGFEDARNAHSMFLQVGAETGLAGLVLWAALCGICLWACLRALGSDAGEADAAACPKELRVAGSLLAAGVLAFDCFLLGTLIPPRHAPAWLEAMPWLGYVVVLALWIVTFRALTAGALPVCSREAEVGGAAALAAFLLHSAGEHTLMVPALGGTAAAALGLGLSCRAPDGRLIGPRTGRLLLTGALLLIPVWALAVVRPALVAASASQDAWLLSLLRRAGRPVGAHEISRAHRQACAAVPWDAENWRKRAGWELDLLQRGAGRLNAKQVVAVAERAVELSPLNSAGRRLLGAARAAAGDMPGSVEAFGEAARLAPTLPLARFEYARALEAAGADAARVRGVYQQALELLPLQYSSDNRILGGPAELAAFWRQTTGRPVGASPADLAMALGDDAARQRAGALIGGDLRPADTEGQLEIWTEFAPVLWRVALEAKVRSLGGAAPVGEKNGASGGT